MTAINDLLEQVDNSDLRNRLEQEINRTIKNKKFGLVYEEHLPECTPLYGVKVKRGSTVAKKTGQVSEQYKVAKINDGVATCVRKSTGEITDISLDELVSIAEFGEAIYPQLIPVDYVENSPESNLWHTLIEADNYHALQLLEYLYPKKVDCIYIDPPYNTGAKDWKYNNDYVDSSDSYRHSKWLSMMEKRLKIAKCILKSDGVLIIAIDKNELAHLICLLEEPTMFAEFDITIVSIVHNPRGNITINFAETNEYAVYVTPKGIRTLERERAENDTPRKLRRWGHFSLREERRSMFYPIYVKDGKVVDIGEQPEDNFHPTGRNIILDNGEIEVWPIDQDGVERRWNYAHSEIMSHIDRIIALPKDGGIDLFLSSELKPPKTVWVSPELDAGGVHGSTLVENIVGNKFPYPKSLYTVVKSLEPVVRNKPNCTIVDFFAGSGTTLNAVNLINAEDNGNRRCIMVTNNEVSEEEAKALKSKGLNPGDDEWENKGICRSITWLRSKYSIQGNRDDGTILEGEYLSVRKCEVAKQRKFKKLDFVTSENLSTPNKKKQLVALLGKEKLAQSLVKGDSKYIVSEKYSASILFDDTVYEEWISELENQDHIIELYIVTQSNQIFNEVKDRVTTLMGDYFIYEQVKKPMSEGFKANCEYFKLGFLDKNEVALGRQFKELIPILWMKAGAIGKRPEIEENEIPDKMILPDNKFAILVNESHYIEFEQEVEKYPEIDTVFVVTDSEAGYREIISKLKVKNTYQLYRDYLDNFRINSRR